MIPLHYKQNYMSNRKTDPKNADTVLTANRGEEQTMKESRKLGEKSMKTHTEGKDQEESSFQTNIISWNVKGWGDVKKKKEEKISRAA